MPKNKDQMNHNGEEIDLIEIIRILLGYKFLIILITLIFTLSGFFYSTQKQPIYRSNILIEIGSYGLDQEPSGLIEDQSSLIHNLNINFIYKNKNNNLEEIQFTPLENKLIFIENKSFDKKEGISFLNNTITYIEKRHSQLVEERKNSIKNEIKSNERKIKYINSRSVELENTYQNRIQKIEDAIISERSEKELIKSLDSLTNVDFNDPVFKKFIEEKLISEFVNDNLSSQKEIINLQEKIEDLSFSENSLTFELEEKIFKLKALIEDLDSNKEKTQAISEIESHEVKSNNLSIILSSLIIGLIVSMFIVFISNLVKTFKKSST